MVGVDIGCGMETVELREREVDFEKLDALIRREIPYGREVRDIPHALNAEINLTHLRCTRSSQSQPGHAQHRLFGWRQPLH